MSDGTKLSSIQQLDQQAEVALKELKATGKLPEGTSDAIALLAKQKKMTRDTQAQFTKTNQALISANAKADALQGIALQVTPDLTEAQTEELEELKYSDPDQWRVKVNEYEKGARQSRETTIAQTVETSQAAATKTARLDQLKEFTAQSGITLTDDIIANDLPPRMAAELDAGTISFEEFLNQAGKFLKSAKVIVNTGEGDMPPPNFDKTTGSPSADNADSQGDFTQKYANNELEY